MTTAAMATYRVLATISHDDDGRVANVIWRYAASFACVAVIAIPVFTPDVWLSLGWGRMAASGTNPYYVQLRPQDIQGLPTLQYTVTMTYGPTWAWLATAVAVVGRGNSYAMFLIAKLLLLSLWLLCLWLISASLSGRDRCIGLIIFGWTPLSYLLTVAEGHNDIAMMLGVLLWIYLAKRQQLTGGNLSLFIGTMVKYACAPLAVIAAVDTFRASTQKRTAWIALLIPIAAIAAIFAPFSRDWHLINTAIDQRDIEMLSLAQVSRLISTYISTAIAKTILAIAILAITSNAFILAARHIIAPSNYSRVAATIATMSAVIYVASGRHMTPWYLMWTLSVSSLDWKRSLSQFNIALALLIPFAFDYSFVVMAMPRTQTQLDIATSCAYLSAFGWALWSVLRRRNGGQRVQAPS
jgi:hypothetical protein